MEFIRLPLQRIDVFVQLECRHRSLKCRAFRNRAEFRRPLAVPARRDGVRPIDLLRSHDAGEYNGSSDGEKPGGACDCRRSVLWNFVERTIGNSTMYAP